MKHSVLGFGPVGQSAVAALLRRGLDVHVVSRTRPARAIAGVTHHALDVRDTSALRNACAGSQALYQCMGAPYHQWSTELPPLQAAALEVAVALRAKFVSFENVYMYGAPCGEAFDEGSPYAPCSQKGLLRATMAATIDARRDRGDLEAIHVRASDLFGPGMKDSALGEEIIGRAVRGKSPRGLGDLRAPHTWTYTVDAGETLARVGTRSTTVHVYHVPSDVPRSQAEIITLLALELRHKLSARPTPRWVLSLLGIARPEIGALVEMLYEFKTPFVVDDRRSRALLEQEPTNFEYALRETATWFAKSSEHPFE